MGRVTIGGGVDRYYLGFGLMGISFVLTWISRYRVLSRVIIGGGVEGCCFLEKPGKDTPVLFV